MALSYYLNGEEIDERGAKNAIGSRAEQQGYEDENWDNAWRHRATSEESREFLNMVSGYEVEILAD
jgi:hypothetical protein